VFLTLVFKTSFQHLFSTKVLSTAQVSQLGSAY